MSAEYAPPPVRFRVIPAGCEARAALHPSQGIGHFVGRGASVGEHAAQDLGAAGQAYTLRLSDTPCLAVVGEDDEGARTRHRDRCCLAVIEVAGQCDVVSSFCV